MERNENIQLPVINLLPQSESQNVIHDGHVKGQSNIESDAKQTTLSQNRRDSAHGNDNNEKNDGTSDSEGEINIHCPEIYSHLLKCNQQHQSYF